VLDLESRFRVDSRRFGRSLFSKGNAMTPSIAALHYLSLYLLLIDSTQVEWLRVISLLLVVADINDTAHKHQNIPGVNNQTIQLLTF
jgi:hypothetical protein